jgi:hypothetical protein
MAGIQAVLLSDPTDKFFPVDNIGINRLCTNLLVEGVNTIVQNQPSSWPPTLPKLAHFNAMQREINHVYGAHLADSSTKITSTKNKRKTTV